MTTFGRLAAYWFAMAASLGVYFPYFAAYLRETLELSGAQIGLVFAVLPLVGMAAQPLWGQLGDRTGERARVLTLLSAGTAVGYLVLPLATSFATVLAATAALALFSTSQIPMAVAVSLSARTEGEPLPFGRVRVFGTLGFLVTVAALPGVLGAVARGRGRTEAETFHVVFYFAAALSLVATCIAASFPRTQVAARTTASTEDLRRLCGDRDYLRVLLVCFAAFLFLHGPLALFPVYVRARGGDTSTVSQMWMWMLALETVMLVSAPALYQRLGPHLSVAVGMVAGGLRLLTCGLVHELRWLFPVQMLHGVMVFSLQVAAPMFVESLVPDRLRASGQAGLAMLGASVGGIASSVLAGQLLDAAGIDTVFVLAGLGATTVGLLAPWLLPRRELSHPSA